MNSKRDCRFNLGGHCETENAAAVAAHWNYLDSPWSPGRRRKRVNENAAQKPRTTSRFNVLYRQFGIATSPPDTTNLLVPSRRQRALPRRRCLRYVVTSTNSDLEPQVTCSVQLHRTQWRTSANDITLLIAGECSCVVVWKSLSVIHCLYCIVCNACVCACLCVCSLFMMIGRRACRGVNPGGMGGDASPIIWSGWDANVIRPPPRFWPKLCFDFIISRSTLSKTLFGIIIWTPLQGRKPRGTGDIISPKFGGGIKPLIPPLMFDSKNVSFLG